MIRFTFLIKKELCFAHWVRLMLFWCWPETAIKWEKFDIKKYAKYYFDFVNGLTDHEKDILNKLKGVLENKKVVAQWFWDRYLGKEILDAEENEIWGSISKELMDKFNRVWLVEYPRLIYWQDFLQKYDFNFGGVISKISKFLGVVETNANVVVYLNIFFGDHTLHAETKKHENFIHLDISNLDKKFFNKVVSIFIHEATHILFNESQKEELIFQSFFYFRKQSSDNREVLSKGKNSITTMPWDYLMGESIVSSISGQGFNYVNRVFFPENITEEEKNYFSNFKYKDNEKNLSHQIKAVAYRLSDITKEYLENNREMDKDYSDFVIKNWLEFRKGV